MSKGVSVKFDMESLFLLLFFCVCFFHKLWGMESLFFVAVSLCVLFS